MPRDKRKKSSTKVYHVIDRGINKQDILLDKQDFIKYVEEIKNTKEKYEYEIYAYALMNDHVHFIIHDKNENMSKAIQSLNIRYSSYFNKKYQRTGHLFENRFRSKVVESESYLKNLVRYIHKNPECAGLKPYIWTSYNEYLSRNNIISGEAVLKVFGDYKGEALNNFKKFHKDYIKFQDYNKDYELVTQITDEEAIDIIKNILKEENLLKVQNYEKNEKEKAIKIILEIEGIRKEQLSRILGISTKTIRNIEKKSSEKGQISD